MNQAQIIFNTITSKFELVYNDKRMTIAFVEQHILERATTNKKVKANNITSIVKHDGSIYQIPQIGENSFISTPPQNAPSQITIKTPPTFNINKRFGFMENLIQMIISKNSESLIITGDGGLGKTYTVMNTLKENEVHEHTDYEIVKGYSTARGLYNTLFENKNKVIIFDDCDSILKDPVAKNILKGALDSYDKRIITWNSQNTSDIPNTFEFKGRIIFISNMKLQQFDQALISRSLVIDLSMSIEDKIERMSNVLENVMPNVDINIKIEALDFISDNAEIVQDLNFRTLIKVIKIVNSFPEEWKDLALYSITAK